MTADGQDLSHRAVAAAEGVASAQNQPLETPTKQTRSLSDASTTEESKANDEKSREVQAQLQKQIEVERGGRDDIARQRADASIQAENARREVLEMRRELAIAKDEARRAWEELGRRNQEGVETAQSLRDGRVTLVHGVQVLPYSGGPSRSVSAGQRPSTRDGQPQYGSTGLASQAGAAGLGSFLSGVKVRGI